MKKIISIILCAIMLVGVMTSSVFAEDETVIEVPDEGWLLKDFGQKSFNVKKAGDIKPIIDGTVEEGEYSLVIYDMVPIDNWSDGRFFLVDDCSGIDCVSMYFSHDDDYIYVAVETTNNNTQNNTVQLSIGVNMDDITYSEASLKFSPSDTRNPVARFIEEYSNSTEDKTVTYEAKLKRDVYATYAQVDSVDSFYLRAVITSGVGEMWFGFELPWGTAEAVLPKHNISSERFPHVIYLDEEIYLPETDAPKTDAPDSDVPDTNDESTPVTDPAEEQGCGASVTAVSAALIGAFGLCAAACAKKKED